MSGRVWSKSSREKLATCHELLRILFNRALAVTAHDLTVTCGHRSKADQDAAYKGGKSKLKWPKSRHNSTPSLAVDVSPYIGGTVSWDLPRYAEIAPAIKAEWAKMQAEGLVPAGVTLEWGGDWSMFVDAPHWQLSGIQL